MTAGTVLPDLATCGTATVRKATSTLPAVPCPLGAAPNRLDADDIARAVLYAMTQPPHVDINEIAVRSVGQEM